VKRIICILFFLYIWIGVFSQFSNPTVINRTNELAVREAKFTLNYRDIEGNPYYTSDFINGVAYLKDGNYASLPLRYDIFRDEIEFIKENKIYWLKKSDLLYVRYGSDILVLTNTIADTSQIGYFFLKSTGKNKLLFKKTISYNPEVPPKGYSETVPARFKEEVDEFYIQLEGKPIQKVKSSKDLTTIFENNKTAIDYIKKEKIKATRINDLQKLFIYLNSQ
jgi:hypothetical protein